MLNALVAHQRSSKSGTTVTRDDCKYESNLALTIDFIAHSRLVHSLLWTLGKSSGHDDDVLGMSEGGIIHSKHSPQKEHWTSTMIVTQSIINALYSALEYRIVNGRLMSDAVASNQCQLSATVSLTTNCISEAR
jgi:hypothetical protein